MGKTITCIYPNLIQEHTKPKTLMKQITGACCSKEGKHKNIVELIWISIPLEFFYVCTDNINVMIPCEIKGKCSCDYHLVLVSLPHSSAANDLWLLSEPSPLPYFNTDCQMVKIAKILFPLFYRILGKVRLSSQKKSAKHLHILSQTFLLLLWMVNVGHGAKINILS